jgi:hypothetical protein
LDSKEFIEAYGKFLYIFLGAILPILTTIVLSILIYGEEVFKESKSRKITNAILILIAISVAILGYFGYKDSRRTTITIYSEHPIYQVRLDSESNRNAFNLLAISLGNNRYTVAKRIPYGEYNITLIFESEPNQFFSRIFKKQTEILVVF